MRRCVAGVLLSAVLIGCAAPAPPSRSARLLSLAGTEAGQVADPQARLKRQLNVADRQLDGDRPAAARQSLAAAAGTMRDAGPDALPRRIRIAGWVSISELSRKADDPAAADAACDQAVVALRSVTPEAERAEYAVGVAREVRALRGQPAAARLLVESAAWAQHVPSEYGRRRALAETADELFDCDDDAAGLAVLRTDPDPAWRSDTLVRLAEDRSDWASMVGNAAIPGAATRTEYGVVARRREPSSPRFGQSVDYQSVFAGPSTQP